MSKFEVHIPATDGNGFNVTLKVGADNWMSALKAGLQKLGEQGTISQNVMVDIQEDNSIHVTEAASGRVFRIREMTEEDIAKAQVKRPSQIRPAVAPAPAQRAEVKTEPGIPAVKRPDDHKTQPLPKPDLDTTKKGGEALKMPSPDLNKTLPGNLAAVPASIPAAVPRNATPAPRQHKPSARLELKDVEELVQPIRPSTGSIGRAKSSPNIAKSQRQETEDILADIFLRVVDLGSKKEIEEAMEFVLDLVMEKVPCEAGSVLRADGATGDLTFVAARGPKAKEILRANIIVPAGTGIAGFCAAEGVSVAVSDVEKDPRFYAEVGARVGYATRSMLCAPMMTHGRSFGCVQVINRKGGPQFLEHEVGVMAYLAHQAALFLNQKLLE
ncbi:MAG: GAF domain-containing protein [Archangium sp.]|nr:GAF domain-containing protein [Archangium sp.]